MRTKDYIIKYKLNIDDKFSHSDFVNDLAADFMALLEVGKATETLKGFDNAVNAIRMKFDAINNKTVGCISEKLWNYFYATIIVKMREELFPEQMRNKRELAEERRQNYMRQKEARKSIDNMFEEELRKDWENRRKFWQSLFTNISKPIDSIEILGLQNVDNIDADAVNLAYRKLVKIHHPDLGGKQEMFVNITAAKNKLLAWIIRR